MKQVIQNMRTGETRLEDVPPPKIGKGEVLVANKASLISAGTEKMIMDFANKSLIGKAKERPDLVKKVVDKLGRDGVEATVRSVFSKLEEPLPLGYSAAGVVVDVAQDLAHIYKKGDRVAIAGAGMANHAELNAVPKNLIAPLPKDVSFEDGCFATLTAIAMQGVRNAHTNLGDRVLVLGLGLVGQLAAQLLKANGCHVMAMDFDSERLAIARECGVDKTFQLGQGQKPDVEVDGFTNSKGFDSVLICAATDSNEPLETAAKFARDRARVVLVGKVGTEVDYASFMKKELEFVISRSYGPGRYDKNFEQKGQEYPIGYVRWTEADNLKEATTLMASGKLNVAPLVSHTFPIDEAEEAYGVVMSGDIPSLGVVLSYGADNSQAQTRVEVVTEPVTGDVCASFIGAGAFARGVLLPALQKVEGVRFGGVMTKSGMSAKSAAKRFNFLFATSELSEILDDAEANTVFITTHHSSHAELVQKALAAGKYTFVEKPLAMTKDELTAVKKAHDSTSAGLMVGFNRRFSPYMEKLVSELDKTPAPRQINIRINAGKLDADNWQNDPEVGGGRLLGEVCHFIDAALHLAGSKPVQVSATQGTGQDVYSVTITFENGSIANVFYTSEGHSGFSKERFEVFSAGTVGMLDNFRHTYVKGPNGTVNFKLGKVPFVGAQDKGHRQELQAFADFARGKGPAPIKFEDLFATTLVTLLAKESIEKGMPLPVDL